MQFCAISWPDKSKRKLLPIPVETPDHEEASLEARQKSAVVTNSHFDLWFPQIASPSPAKLFRKALSSEISFR